jgi:hypothetical protein
MRILILLLSLFIETVSYSQTYEWIEIDKSINEIQNILFEKGFVKENGTTNEILYSNNKDRLIIAIENDSISSITVRSSEYNKWLSVKSNYDKQVNALSSKFGKPYFTKNSFDKKFKTGNEIQQILNADASFFSLFEYNSKKNVIVEIKFSKRKKQVKINNTN